MLLCKMVVKEREGIINTDVNDEKMNIDKN